MENMMGAMLGMDAEEIARLNVRLNRILDKFDKLCDDVAEIKKEIKDENEQLELITNRILCK